MSERRRRVGDPMGHTYTEQYRHECEVRYICARPTRQERAEYLAGVDKRRGAARRRLSGCVLMCVPSGGVCTRWRPHLPKGKASLARARR
jgi:hypothetical protein